MNEETEIFTKPIAGKPAKHADSVGSVSIRAWLAVALIGAVVIRSMSVGVLVIIYVYTKDVPLQDAVKALDISEPLYTMSGMALAYYFGQQKQQQTPAETPK